MGCCPPLPCRIRKEAPVDARTIEEHRKHRQRLSAINGGDIPPERTIPVPMYADGTPVTKVPGG